MQKKWGLSFRIWHWLHALVVIGLIGTVLLRKTFLSWRDNSEILTDKLFDMDIDVTLEQSKILAKAIRAPMWEWHIILGYALAALVIYRLLLFFTESEKKSFINFSSLNLHKKMVKLSYIGIYTILLFMTVSGFVLLFYKDLGLLKTTAHDINVLHEFMFIFIWAFVLLHLGGLIVADNTDEKGVISDMINGG